MAGITNITNVTIDKINEIANSSSVPEFFIKVNHDIYGGIFWFVLLIVLWIILFVTANKVRDQPLNNAMYSGAIVSILSILIRGVNISRNGVVQGMITDHQLWIFPLITVILAVVIWAIKD